MTRWNDTVARLRARGQPAMLVRVDSVRGSTPREAGARMIVTADTFHGSIGGGNLEYQACRIARDQLAIGETGGLRRFPLGAGLGQCCGGVVNLSFERLEINGDWRRAERDECHLPLLLFGAGHVGSALVAVLDGAPFDIVWVDTRDGLPPLESRAGVEAITTESPEAEVDAAPPGSAFLVMTHDHALDQRLAEQILKRDDFAYFGLIGSASKRRLFEKRMAHRGVDRRRFADMTCPIGIPGIDGKQPAQIAISVAAELLQVYDRSQNNNADNNQNMVRERG